MAIIIPRIPTDYHGSPGEAEAILSLRHLPGDYYIYHSLRWLSGTCNGTQGEADLVVFHPDKGWIVIEIKSGGIRCADRIWFQKNRQTGAENVILDPAAQAERSRFELVRKVQPCLPAGESCRHGHGVWFTSIDRKDFRYPPNYVSEVVLDRSDLSKPEQAIERIFTFWSDKRSPGSQHRLTPRGAQCVRMALAPEVDAAPSMRASIEERDAHMVRLTRDQSRVLDFLEEQPVAAICGAAGTGKTLIGWEKARRLASKGDKVLFLCYNSELKEYLRKKNINATLDVHSFHSLAGRHVRAADDYDTLEREFLDWMTRGETALPYQHILIDEAQDFHNDWLGALSACVPRDGFFYVFFDRYQLVNRENFSSWLTSVPCRLVLDTNCRNTRQVARSSRAFFPELLKRNTDAVEGPASRLHLIESEEARMSTAATITMQLITNEGFLPEEIAILAFEKGALKPLLSTGTLGRTAVTESLEVGKITATTIRRFKGLEAKAVILLDMCTDILSTPNGCREYYVGSSRAMHQLHLILLRPSDDAVAALVSQISSGGDRKLRKTLNGLTKFLHANI